MQNTAILKRTQELPEESPLGGDDVDAKVRHLLRAEYLRRLGHIAGLFAKENMPGMLSRMQWSGKHPLAA